MERPPRACRRRKETYHISAHSPTLVLHLAPMWKFRRLNPIEKENAALKTTIVVLRHELTTKEDYAAKLELVLHQRLETIDTLRGTIDQLREQNRRLDEEADRLAEMVRFAPQLDGAMLAPK